MQRCRCSARRSAIDRPRTSRTKRQPATAQRRSGALWPFSWESVPIFSSRYPGDGIFASGASAPDAVKPASSRLSSRLGALKPGGLLLGSRQIDLANLDHRLVAAEKLQFTQNLGDMGLDGRFGELELDRDVFVLKSAPDQFQHPKLLRRQFC